MSSHKDIFFFSTFRALLVLHRLASWESGDGVNKNGGMVSEWLF